MTASEYPPVHDYGGARRAAYPETSEGERLARIIRKHIRTLGITNRPRQAKMLRDLRQTNVDHTELLRAMVNVLPYNITMTHRVHEVLTERGFPNPSSLITESLMEANAIIHRTFLAHKPLGNKSVQDLVILAATSLDPLRVAGIIEERRIQSAEEVAAVLAESMTTEPVLSSGIL